MKGVEGAVAAVAAAVSTTTSAGAASQAEAQDWDRVAADSLEFNPATIELAPLSLLAFRCLTPLDSSKSLLADLIRALDSSASATTGSTPTPAPSGAAELVQQASQTASDLLAFKERAASAPSKSELFTFAYVLLLIHIILFYVELFIMDVLE